MVLPQQHRLKRRQDFAMVYQQGVRLSSKRLLLRLKRQPQRLPIPDQLPPPTRIGISISQKVSKLAVVRNRLKRQLRAGCRQLLAEIKPGWDVVIVVRVGVECDYWQFLQELKQLMVEAKILHGH